MKRVLFVNQDTIPYVEETELSRMGKLIPQRIQEAGSEIRTFMPRWGNINERRGQLHEVIRLSGTNIAINDTDHPLIIKVASIAGTKVQVYFIDNEELFSRKGQLKDADGNFYEDNGERAVFYARGVIETLKKLRWIPDVIHCQGVMSYLVPLYIKNAYKDVDEFKNIKVVTSICSDKEAFPIENNFKQDLLFNAVTMASLENYNDTVTYTDLAKIAVDNSDGIIKASKDINDEILGHIESSAAKVIEHNEADFQKEYIQFYNQL